MLKKGDPVEVLDPGLAMLRKLCPDQPPNHLGRVDRIDGETVYVEFPIGGSYEHSQVATYPSSMVRSHNADPMNRSFQGKNNGNENST